MKTSIMFGNNVVKTLSHHDSVRRVSILKTLFRCSTSTAAQSIPDDSSSSPITSKASFFRTNESDPLNHSSAQHGQFYTINPHTRNKLFLHGGVSKKLEKNVETFREMCLMVRNPALEIMSYMKAANYSDPVIRYVLYGRLGTGKSVTLAHLLHYASAAGYLLVHVPWAPNWFRRFKDSTDSPTKEGFVDLPLDSAAWLLHFKTQNAALLSVLDLTVGEEYVWSKRETTPKGARLVDLVELGISRVKYAPDCIAALLKEIKQNSELGRCKTLVAIDGFNTFFYPKTTVRLQDRTYVTPDKVSITQPFLDITKLNWSNGAVVVTVDENAVGDDHWESYLPRYQLGKEGFEHLDPFIPVKVENYSPKEFESCLSYYVDRKWITNSQGNTENGKKELAFLSGMNPYQLMQITASL